MTPDQFAQLQHVLSLQEDHPFLPPVRAELREGQLCLWMEDRFTRLKHAEGGFWGPATPELIATALQTREKAVVQIGADNFTHGIWFDVWHEALWELCRLRVANPGVPVEFLVSGSNGSAKTFFACAVLSRAMMTTKDKLFWSITLNEPNSQSVQQRWQYFWLPNEYKTLKGSIQGTARAKLKFNDSGGFTDNRFSLRHGAMMEYRFWSASVDTLEGIRPYAVWSDEEIPVDWIDGVKRRLLTAAGGTVKLIPQWQKLLAEKEANPAMRFPLEKIGELMMGVHLITYTPKNGYTPTVAAFIEGGKIMRTVEADVRLLPRRAPDGEILGGEILPKLIHCKDPSRRAIWFHAWENPIGGNWQGMIEAAKDKPRPYKLWWCYGIAEKSGNTPFPNFNVQVHVRPKSWLPPAGTWYHIVDPVASGGRQWAHLWAIVSATQHYDIWPGDIVIAHEFPQQDDYITGMGYVGEWAIPGGKNGIGVRGPAQETWPVGYQFRAEEIKRVERKLAAWMRQAAHDVHAKTYPGEPTPIVVPDGNRIMDSRPFNTETASQSESKTIAEYMEDNGLFFVPAGRGGNVSNNRHDVIEGEQQINDALMWNRELAVLDEKTGWLRIDPQKGRGPRLWILEHCTNLIASIQHYPGNSPDSAWKDFIDCLRYLVIADPVDFSGVSAVSYNGQR